MDNNKSSALISVADLNTVLFGVKKYIDSSNSKITIDKLVNREFGELVSGELNGMIYQGVLTDIPVQEGLFVNVSNIRYDGDIHYLDSSYGQEQETIISKDTANNRMKYPANLSGAISDIGGSLGLVHYVGTGESAEFHALVDLGFSYMVYVDNYGATLTEKPFISYPLKLEVQSLISKDYVESSLGNSSLSEDLNSIQTKLDKIFELLKYATFTQDVSGILHND